MDRQQVIDVLDALANGLDPTTGAPIPYDTFHQATTIRALFAAVSLLKNTDVTTVSASAGRRTTTKLASAGAAWNKDEDTRLCQEFDTGMTIGQIALQHGRTSGAITARLVKLGRLDPATVKSRDRGARIVQSATSSNS